MRDGMRKAVYWKDRDDVCWKTIGKVVEETDEFVRVKFPLSERLGKSGSTHEYETVIEKEIIERIEVLK